MKFGDTFKDYLQGDQEWFLQKCAHFEYKRLKKVLKRCRACRAVEDEAGADDLLDSCPLCDQKFFTELTKEASEVVGCFSSKVRRLLSLHVNSGMLRLMWRLRHCFTDDQQVLINEGRILLDYVTMNAIAVRKILKKYDKVHGSVNGRNFKTKLQAERIELLQSPWLIELGAFYINTNGSDIGGPGKFLRNLSCNLSGDQPIIAITLSESIKYEYSLKCAVCLDIVFNPYALSCGHLFCKSCACSSASVLIFEGLKTASKTARCPVCRSAGVYHDAVHMVELDLLLKTRCNEYWKERLCEERTEMLKQCKDYWEAQRITAMSI